MLEARRLPPHSPALNGLCAQGCLAATTILCCMIYP